MRMSEKSKKALALRKLRNKQKYGVLHNVAESCRKKAIEWNNTKAAKAA